LSLSSSAVPGFSTSVSVGSKIRLARWARAADTSEAEQHAAKGHATEPTRHHPLWVDDRVFAFTSGSAIFATPHPAD
jgi:hypothetical protein